MDAAGGRLPRANPVRNKAPAEQQITAEQIVLEARHLQDASFKPPEQKIQDEAELAEYRLRKRKGFEDNVRRMRWNQAAWAKYAKWEEDQKDYRRARSVYERALEVSHTDPALWVKYAEMEMRGRFIAHARNVWDRAVTLLPRVDQLWYKYVHMEEVLGDVDAARAVFERWMAFEPDHYAWAAFLKFEGRYAQWDRARALYERYILCHPTVLAYTRYAKFEAARGRPAAARAVYERAVGGGGLDPAALDDGALYLAFAAFEAGAGEPARARAIYRYALDHVPKATAPAVFEALSAFERAHGDRAGVDTVVAGEARFEHEAALKANPLNYDTWFEYARLEEGVAAGAAAGPGGRSPGNPEWVAAAARVREVYERAVAHLPPCGDGRSAGLPPDAAKRLWARYIYLWLRYAVWEELGAADLPRAREVYRAALAVIPHASFTFGKVWVAAAHAAVRGRDLPSARRTLGQALGRCPKPKLYRSYIALELALGSIDRARTLHAKWVEWAPGSAEAWTGFAELEAGLGEVDRARALYDLALSQPSLDAPDAVWKAAIAFEVGARQRSRARALYERLLERTRHVKVWLAYAAFEGGRLPAPALEGDDDDAEDTPSAAAARADAADAADPAESLASRIATARGVYERAYRYLREDAPELKEEAVAVLEAWRAAEAGAGEAARADAVAAKLPRRVKRKRPAPEGSGVAMEEYYDYVFPDEGQDGGGGGGGGSAAALRLLEAAQAWKKRKLEAGAE